MRGREVCYYHGGKTRPSKGEKNGQHRHGFYTSEAIAARKALRALISDAVKQLEDIKAVS